jgi:hypothetical protein
VTGFVAGGALIPYFVDNKRLNNKTPLLLKNPEIYRKILVNPPPVHTFPLY